MKRNNLKLVGLFSLLALSFSGAEAGVFVSELMPCNISTHRGDDTNYHGWVELYNDGEEDVDLKGYVFKNLKKGGSEKWSWTIPQSLTIEGEGFMLIYFGGDGEKERRAPYKIDTDGGTLQLFSGGKQVSSLKYTAMVPHISYGVDEDGNVGYMNPTPKKDNHTAYTSLGSRCSKPTFGTQPGICSGPINLSISTATADAKIYYTLDGSEPSSKNGTLYEGPIEVKRGDDKKSVVVRARAVKSGLLTSAVTTGSYIFMDGKHEECNGFTVPILSLTMDVDDYKGDEYGIAVKGTNGVSLPGKSSCLPERANYSHQDWDRPANFEYFVDGKQVVSQEVEVAVMGGCSRRYDVKSFKVNVSKKTGSSTIKYPFFATNKATEYKSLHIRNGGNTYGGFMIRDALLQVIARSMGLDCQDFQPVAYYINGSYKGMMGLRTRSNKDLVYAKYGVEEENLDVIEVAETGVSASSGTMDAYDELVSALKSKDKTSPTFLDEIGEMMDIDSYIDYQIFEQFIVNTDWPGNNTKLWREHQNGRFRWIVYDTDFGFGLYGHDGNNLTYAEHDMIKFCMGENTHNWANEKDFAVVIFKNLMENEDFQNRFLTRYLYHLDNTFKMDNIEALWAPYEKMCKDEFCASPIAGGWEGGWNSMKEFARNRPDNVYGHLKSFFKCGEKIKLRVAIKDEGGNVIPNANIVLNNVSTGTANYETPYFVNRSLRIDPKVPAGYTFKKWSTSSEVSTKVTTSPILTDETTWSYYFKDTVPSGNWNAASYDASAWKTGKGSFGMNWRDNEIPSVKLQDGDSVPYITSYYRTKFNVADPSAIDSLLLEVLYDDGVILYLNGKELKRYNMPSGTVKYGTYAADYTERNKTSSFFVSKSALVKGENVIAAEVHQYSGSSDMGFSLSLSEIVGKEVAGGNEIFEGVLMGDQEMVAIYTKNASVDTPTLRLNEVCASNNSDSGNADEFGNYPDWIEIHNYGTKDLDLAGLYLTDDKSKLGKSPFPYGSENTIIKAGEHKIVYADNAPWRGSLHADFKIDRLGGFLGLAYGKWGKVVLIDSINLKPMATNESYGRVSDGVEGWTFFADDCSDKSGIVTYGKKNGTGCSRESSGMDNYLVRLPDEVEPKGIAVYPNPASDWVTVKTTGEFDDAETVSGIYEVSIYNPQGLLVAQVRADGKPECTVAIDRLLPGIYYLKAVSDYSVFSTVFKKQ